MSYYSLTGLHKDSEKIPNSFDQEYLENPVSLAYPPLPRRATPGSPIMTDGLFKGPLTEKQAHHGAQEEFAKGRQCTYLASLAQ